MTGPLAVATTQGAVWQRLRKHYPPHVLQWVRNATWHRRAVPLDRVRLQPRPGHPADPAKVAGIRAAIRHGDPMPPVILVDNGRGKLKIGDGYHRLIAARAEGQATHPALIAELHRPQRTGPWSRAMHDEKLNV